VEERKTFSCGSNTHTTWWTWSHDPYLDEGSGEKLKLMNNLELEKREWHVSRRRFLCS